MNTMPVNSTLGNSSLEKLLRNELREAYWSERHFAKLLLKIRKAANSIDIRASLDQQHARIEDQVLKLEEIFLVLGKKIKVKKSESAKAIAKSIETLIDDTNENSVTRDVAIIISARKINHYCAGTFGGLLQIANMLGLSTIADSFTGIMLEKKHADELLAHIPVSGIYLGRADSGHDDEEEDDDEPIVYNEEIEVISEELNNNYEKDLNFEDRTGK
ncbi:MAG: DUF892 family protein [Chitinophagaceae bacterium]|nr:MAG: DUF892 family protein [Chitinophagaceae bacterium]